MTQAIVFTGAKLFTGVDESVIENASIWVDNERIMYAGQADGLGALDTSIKSIDLKGQFVMPFQ